jgi:hypothetical protein
MPLVSLVWGVSVALLLSVAITAESRAQHCARCGTPHDCCKICRLEKSERKVSIVCWGVECEDFCVPGPSHRGDKHCETVCTPNDPHCGGVASQAKPWVWFDWLPSCSAQMYTRKKLMKRTITRTVPSYKWVVEDLCPRCEKNLPPLELPASQSLPPPPPGVRPVAP